MTWRHPFETASETNSLHSPSSYPLSNPGQPMTHETAKPCRRASARFPAESPYDTAIPSTPIARTFAAASENGIFSWRAMSSMWFENIDSRSGGSGYPAARRRSRAAAGVTSFPPWSQRPSLRWDDTSAIARSVALAPFVAHSVANATDSAESGTSFVGARESAWSTSFCTLGSRTSASTSGCATIAAAIRINMFMPYIIP